MALAALIIAATAFALVVLPRAVVVARPGKGVLRHPGTWLLGVIVLIYVNQVLVTAYVHQAWGGDPSRITRYLPDGWFALADLGPLADRLPALPFTVLHVPAVLELPFVVLAYLLVCRWFGPDVYRRAVRARWAVSASWTATFCLIEWSLHNPYTAWDIALRVVSGLAVPLLVGLLGEGAAAVRPGPAVASAVALGVLVLAVYDSALLYNLAHVVSWLPLVVPALLVLAAARWWARLVAVPGPVMTVVMTSIGWFLVLFLVPALPLRYGLNFGVPVVSFVAGVAVVGAALWLGWERSATVPLLVVAAGGVVGAVVGYVGGRGFPEARLLAAAAGFLVVAGVVGVLLDRRSAGASKP